MCGEFHNIKIMGLYSHMFLFHFSIHLFSLPFTKVSVQDRLEMKTNLFYSLFEKYCFTTH